MTIPNHPTIYSLFDYPLAIKLHSAGRLNADTTGLILLTDDGQWSLAIHLLKSYARKRI